MISKARRSQTNQRFLKIDITTCRIVEIIGKKEDGVPERVLYSATPETLIRDKALAWYCRAAISYVHKTGNPITVDLPLSWDNQTLYARVQLKKGGRHTDQNTIIAYADPINPPGQEE